MGEVTESQGAGAGAGAGTGRRGETRRDSAQPPPSLRDTRVTVRGPGHPAREAISLRVVMLEVTLTVEKYPLHHPVGRPPLRAEDQLQCTARLQGRSTRTLREST